MLKFNFKPVETVEFGLSDKEIGFTRAQYVKASALVAVSDFSAEDTTSPDLRVSSAKVATSCHASSIYIS